MGIVHDAPMRKGFESTMMLDVTDQVDIDKVQPTIHFLQLALNRPVLKRNAVVSLSS